MKDKGRSKKMFDFPLRDSLCHFPKEAQKTIME